jgi:hypothetical protein
MQVYKTWNLTTVDNKPYTVGVTEHGATFLAWGATVVQIDPAALGGVMGEVQRTLTELATQTCPVTTAVGADTLTCDWKPSHPQGFHHDARGIFWQGQQ